jgi:hypothetical protein
VTAAKSNGLGGDEADQKFDELIASHEAMCLNLDKLILLFEYGGKYAPLEAAELAGQLDW